MFTRTFYSVTHAHTHSHTHTLPSHYTHTLTFTHTHTLTVGLIIRDLPDIYINKLIPFLAERLDHAPHLQFYVRWCRELLCVHGDSLKERSSEVMGSLRDLQKSILQKQRDIGTLYVHHSTIPITQFYTNFMHTLAGACTIHIVALEWNDRLP